ncbi:MAG: TetR/AcrR family transcriptional regulator [Marmoricola sp.]|nr:TetR/AcrR family transcriptional regulator [Marmoricola sp.]
MSTYHHGNLRPALVEAAVGLAQARGPEGVVLREVARQTGVSHNAAYRHFVDRDELLAEVADAAMRQLASAMTDELATVTARKPLARAVARLRATGRAYVHFALAEPGLFEVAFAAHGSPPDDKASPGMADGTEDEQPLERDPYALLGLVLDELVEAGGLTAERREGAEALCWSAVHGFAVLHLHGPLRDVPAPEREASLEMLLDQIERGLL